MSSVTRASAGDDRRREHGDLPLSIDIANESGVDVNEASLAALAAYVLDRMRIHPLAELSVLLVDEDAMADLHQRWMGEPGPTDVLSFPMDELRPPPHLGGSAVGGHEPEQEPGLLGDVVVCPEFAAKQARAGGHRTEDEIELLCIHGILHLLGYDHAEPDDHATMFSLQEQLLASWRAGGRGAGTPDRDGGVGHAESAGKEEQGSPDPDRGGREGPG